MKKYLSLALFCCASLSAMSYQPNPAHQKPSDAKLIQAGQKRYPKALAQRDLYQACTCCLGVSTAAYTYMQAREYTQASDQMNSLTPLAKIACALSLGTCLTCCAYNEAEYNQHEAFVWERLLPKRVLMNAVCMNNDTSKKEAAILGKE